MIETMLLTAFAAFYLTSVLQWQENGENGPFPSNTRFVVRLKTVREDHIDEYRVRVVLFDWVRRLFGLYDIQPYETLSGERQEMWIVKEARLPVWVCARCLSFWCALAVGLLSCLTQPWWMAPVIILASSGGSIFLWWMVEYFYRSSQDVDLSMLQVVRYDDNDDDDENEGGERENTP